MIDVFEWVHKFQQRVGCECFKDEAVIAYAVTNQKHDIDEGEMAVHLYHMNGVCMSLIYCPRSDKECVLVVVDYARRTTFWKFDDHEDVMIDWMYLEDAVCRLYEE